MRGLVISIYCTLWSVKVERPDRWDEFVAVYAQGVPAFIGHPLHYPTDPYVAFLPPPGVCNAMGDGPLRAVVIVREGHDDKDGQRYVSPIATLSGGEYAKITWIDLLARIEAAISEDA